MSMHAVIMAGGAGTRFWPASRQSRPKQFLPLARGKSLIQATVDRVMDFAGLEHTWIVTNEEQARAFPDVLRDFPPEQIILEPEPRDTAPCVALAAAVIEARDPGATMAVMPADHLIEPAEAFHSLLARGAEFAADDKTLVTFGIRPTHPATGFGYIEIGNAVAGSSDAFHVLCFREKPDARVAATFLTAGRFLWNSGIFVWRYAALMRAMQGANPELAACTAEMFQSATQGDESAMHAAFARAPRTSVDYALMEHADQIVVLRAELTWSDVGSFTALHDLVDKDTWNNALLDLGRAKTIAVQSENCTVYSEGDQTVALFGVEDLVVVSTGDVVMVCPRHRASDLKELVQALHAAGRTDLL